MEYRLSDIEKEILHIYMINSNITLKYLSDMLHISISSAKNHVNRLVENGILMPPSRAINLEKLDVLHLSVIFCPFPDIDEVKLKLFIDNTKEIIRSISTFTNRIEIMELCVSDKFRLGEILSALHKFGSSEVSLIKEVRKYQIPIGE